MEWYYGIGPMAEHPTRGWEIVYSLAGRGQSFGEVFIWRDQSGLTILAESVNGVPGRLVFDGRPLFWLDYPLS